MTIRGIEPDRTLDLLPTGNADLGSANGIADICGSVAFSCSDVAGLVQSVIKISKSLREDQANLREMIERLGNDQAMVERQSDDARELSSRAIDQLDVAGSAIENSLKNTMDALAISASLSQQVASFASAISQVKHTTMQIGAIAETTSILALNAEIEAKRAGEAGRTFSVVAQEVKQLASKSKEAAREVQDTVGNLEHEAEEFLAELERSSSISSEAGKQAEGIGSLLGSVSATIHTVDNHNEKISDFAVTANASVGRVHLGLEELERTMFANEQTLGEANGKVEDLELSASDMFDRLVKSGLATDDEIFVDLALENARKITQLTEQAIEAGIISPHKVFADDYRRAEASPIEVYTSAITSWADESWRPVLDEVGAINPRIEAVLLCDNNAYVPTHQTEWSRAPKGDPVHDNKFCRNGRIVMTPIRQRATESTEAYLMAIHRKSGAVDDYEIIKDVFVPLYIQGRRWGDFVLCYV